MVFQSETYSVLLVSASEAFSRSVTPLFPESVFYPVTEVSDLREARRCRADLVVVNAPLPSGDALEYCKTICAESDSAVLLLVPQAQAESVIEKARPFGILVLAKPLSSGSFTQALSALCAMRERLRAREQAQHTVEAAIEELKLINRAKWLLITCLNMTEEEAHRYIGKRAMQQMCSRREIAESIIRTYDQ